MVKKFLSFVFAALLFVTACMTLVSCGEEGPEEPTPAGRDDAAWFTEKELSEKGLSGLPAPTGLTGKMNSSVTWFRDGYFFSQPCPSEDVFAQNAQTYFSYFSAAYDGRFGKPSIEKLSIETNETWYKISEKSLLSDYFDDNPSRLYRFYYVTDETTENGYYKNGAVWVFEIRYEFDTATDAYLFKLTVENAGVSKNGTQSYYYRMKKD